MAQASPDVSTERWICLVLEDRLAPSRAIAGISVADARRGAANLVLVRYRDERNRELIERAEFMFIDGPKNVSFENALMRHLATVKFTKP